MKIKLLAILLLCTVLLAGCGCEHAWADATCDAPKTCTLCGETEGEALGHSWTDASCVAPKTCSACGTTEGEALGHTWVDATCEAPKTCSVCSATEGELLEHVFGDWAPIDGDNEERTCSACGFAEQQAIDHLANLMELLGVSRWYVTEMLSDEGLIDVSEYADDYVFCSTIKDDGSFYIFGKWAGAYFGEGAVEFVQYDLENNSYTFVNERYPSYLYLLAEDEDGIVDLLVTDLSSGLTLFYQQQY